MYINSWDEVPDGAWIIEDTYNEVYEVFTEEGKRYIRQVAWQHGNRPVPENVRLLDFEPNAPYNQPWIRLQ
jgi:hypothetical protein